MITKIYHLADVHIRPFQRLDEYSVKLEEFKELLKKDIGDTPYDDIRIVISGDIVHNKLAISNELIAFASTWIRQLEELGRVVIISGNHDLLVDNKSRVDTLSAIFTAAGFKNAIHVDGYLGYESGIYVDDNITWALYSIFSDYRRPDIEKARRDYPNNTVVGLYHGPIIGASLFNGSSIDSGVDCDIFEGCDIVMAGDIHKRQEIVRGNTEIVYPGSLIQQNFGESISQHGFVVWNMKDKTHKYIDLSTDYSLYNFTINEPEDIDNNKEMLMNA